MIAVGDRIRICYNGTKPERAFVGHKIWYVERVDPATGFPRVSGLPGFQRSWIKLK
jgi:hypothetical protein